MIDIPQLPASDDSERLILGALMNHPEMVEPIRSALSVEDFSVEPYRKLFSAIGEMTEKGEPPNHTHDVAVWLRDRNQLDYVGGVSDLLEIGNAYIRGCYDIEKYVRRVKEYSLRRRLMHVAGKVVNRCSDPTVELDSIVAEMESGARSVYDESQSTSAVTGEQIIRAAGGLSSFFRPRPGIFTPFPTFNNLTGGLSPGDLFIVGARPSVGKTALMMNLASYAAQRGTRVVVFTLEMTGDALMMRLISGAASVTFYQLKMGYLSDEERRRVNAVTPKIASLPILYEGKLGKTVLGIRGEMRRAVSAGPVGLVCVDYLQRMRSPRVHKDRRTEIGEITNGLKEAAMDFKVPFVVLSQLTRESDKQNRPPGMADLIESGNIEADADLIGLLHRPNRKEEMPGVHARAQLLLEKQRNGDTRPIEMVFDKEHGRFYEAETER